MSRAVFAPISAAKALIVVRLGNANCADLVIAEAADGNLVRHRNAAPLTFGKGAEGRKIRNADDRFGIWKTLQQPAHRIRALAH